MFGNAFFGRFYGDSYFGPGVAVAPPAPTPTVTPEIDRRQEALRRERTVGPVPDVVIVHYRRPKAVIGRFVLLASPTVERPVEGVTRSRLSITANAGIDRVTSPRPSSARFLQRAAEARYMPGRTEEDMEAQISTLRQGFARLDGMSARMRREVEDLVILGFAGENVMQVFRPETPEPEKVASRAGRPRLEEDAVVRDLYERGEELRRKYPGMTVEQVADRLGVAPSTYKRYRSRFRAP